MVTIQNIGLQLTKSVKELSDWKYPFSETLETYCSLFNTKDNSNFSEAGLVLQNSTAVFVHRLDYLWNQTDYIRNVFLNNESEETNNTKKKDKKASTNFQDFKIINFAEELEKNIDLKKNHTTHETVKSKSHCFTQLEKSVAQYIPIDIYDVNGEVIGKKYDFRCNQNISVDGILVDEFAPQDFYYGSDNSDQEKSRSTSSPSSHNTESLERSFNTLVTNSVTHDGSDENISIDAESEKNDDDSPEETSDLITSFETSQNIFPSKNDTTVTDTSINNITDLTANETKVSINDINALTFENIVVEDSLLDKNDSSVKYLNNNNNRSVPDSENPSSSPTKTPTMNATASPTEVPKKTKSSTSCIQSTPTTGSPKYKMRMRSKSTPSLSKRMVFKSKKRIVKNLLTEFQKRGHVYTLEGLVSSRTDSSSMFQEDIDTCVKYIQQYNPLQYDIITNETSDFLGFRLHSETDKNINDDDATTSSGDNDEILELRNSSPASPLNERFCDVWFRSDSSRVLSENVDKWHEMMQPKLREAEQRSTFCIRDYTSQIIESLKASKQHRISFNDYIRKEETYEVARYFLASLDLASRLNIDLKRNKDLEHNIELILLETDKQYLSSVQIDPCD